MGLRGGRGGTWCARALANEDHEIGLLGAAVAVSPRGVAGDLSGSPHAGRTSGAGSARRKGRSGRAVGGERHRQVRVSIGAAAGGGCALPPQTQIAVGGAAAEKYAEVLGELQLRAVRSGPEWVELLG